MAVVDYPCQGRIDTEQVTDLLAHNVRTKESISSGSISRSTILGEVNYRTVTDATVPISEAKKQKVLRPLRFA